MDQSEFNILVANVSAIANQTFTIQCGQFASSLGSEETNKISTEPFDLNRHMECFDFQAVLNSGYKDLNDLNEELGQAWSLIDLHSLEATIKQFPNGFPDLTQKLNGSQLRHWITHALETEDESPFYTVHQTIQALFQQGAGDEISDLIREAVAYDELTELVDVEGDILAEHIRFDDLVTAVTIQSFKTFEWLISRANLNEGEIVDLLENSFDDKAIFERAYAILAPTKAQHAAVMKRAKASSESAIIEFLSQLKVV